MKVFHKVTNGNWSVKNDQSMILRMFNAWCCFRFPVWATHPSRSSLPLVERRHICGLAAAGEELHVLTKAPGRKIVINHHTSYSINPSHFPQYRSTLLWRWDETFVHSCSNFRHPPHVILLHGWSFCTLSVPTRTFQWGVDSVHHVKFSPVECHLLGAAASDRSIILYDTREVLICISHFILHSFLKVVSESCDASCIVYSLYLFQPLYMYGVIQLLL